MNILNLLDKAIQMLDGSSKAIDLFKQLMDLSHKITRAEHPSDEADVEEYYRVRDELVKEPKEAIARAYQVNTKIPPTQDTNIIAHYYDDAMQYIQKLGYNIDLPRKKATKEDMEGRCWEGYKPVAGMKANEKGSCEKEMATQSDLNEIQEVIGMLDKAIEFYNPSQPRDENGRWGGGAGGLMISKEKASQITSQEKAYDAVSEHLNDAKKAVDEIDDDAFIKIQQIGYKLRDMQGNSDKNYYSTIMAKADEVANIADKLVNSDKKEARDSSAIFRGATEAMREIAQSFRSNWGKSNWVKAGKDEYGPPLN